MNVRFTPKADITEDRHHVCFVPKADIRYGDQDVRYVPISDIGSLMLLKPTAEL